MWMYVMIMTAHTLILHTVLCFSVQREPCCQTCFHFFVLENGALKALCHRFSLDLSGFGMFDIFGDGISRTPSSIYVCTNVYMHACMHACMGASACMHMYAHV